METAGEIKPCNWYGKQHPFEFEVVVNDIPMAHKIFTALQILSNKATPESLHFEIFLLSHYRKPSSPEWHSGTFYK